MSLWLVCYMHMCISKYYSLVKYYTERKTFDVCVCIERKHSVCVCRFKPMREKSRLQEMQVASLLSQIAAQGQSKQQPPFYSPFSSLSYVSAILTQSSFFFQFPAAFPYFLCGTPASHPLF